MAEDLSVTTAVIVVAAGSGTRLAAEVPKAFVSLAGRTLLEHTLHNIVLLPGPVQIVVVVPESHLLEAPHIAENVSQGLSDQITFVAGGATRHASVEAGLAQLNKDIEVVLIHDAARALTPPEQFADVEMAVRATGAGIIPALPVVDSLKQVDFSGSVLGIAERDLLKAAQTPQGFPKAELLAAFQAADANDYTDDAAVFAAHGGAVTTIPGDEMAFKITTAWDLRRAELLVGSRDHTRLVGLGIDVHAFGPNDGLWLAGLYWPEEKELSGHSDGDAVSHAICDALLSAAQLGDIGSRFGTDDPQYEGASGEVFVRAAVDLLHKEGFAPVNVSVQIVGNKPRFATRRTEAEAVITSWVGAPVSLGATTTDGLGFTGKGEGIAVIATALIHRVS